MSDQPPTKLSTSQRAVLAAIAGSPDRRLRLNTAQLHAIAPLLNWDHPALGHVRPVEVARQGTMYELTELGRIALALVPEADSNPAPDLDDAGEEDTSTTP